VGGVQFDDFGRRKLVARGSRYAPMPSASLGEFNRIAVRIMSSHRTLPGPFVRGSKKYSSGLQMFIQDIEIIRSQFNMNPCSLLWRHADRSQMICAIVREQSNRAAFPASKYASRLSPISPHAWPISCPGCRESDILISKPSEASDVLARKFDVGQSVYLRPNLSTRNAAFGVYEIRATLPAEDGEFRYRIKSQIELHERVVKESELSKA
jgi:hypothetical protein